MRQQSALSWYWLPSTPPGGRQSNVKLQLLDIIRAGNTLGEGVQWNDVTETLWWTDIQARRLCSYRPADGKLASFPTPERLCSFGFVRDDPGFIVAFDCGFARYNPVSKGITRLQRPEELDEGIRFNDGKVDRQGRFWAGTMVERGDPALRPEGGLYSLDGAYGMRKHDSGIGISNGLCWSLESDRLYFADSARRTIYRYEFDRDSGTISNRKVFAETGRGAFPDGAEIDRDGCLWSAHWGAGRVVRYTPEGKTDAVLTLPVSQPTCVTFGGPGHELLFITSAREGLDDDKLAGETHAGDVFVFQVGVSGLPACRFIDGGIHA